MIEARCCANCCAYAPEDRSCFNGVGIAAIGVNGQAMTHEGPPPDFCCQEHRTLEEFEAESDAWEKFGKAIGIY